MRRVAPEGATRRELRFPVGSSPLPFTTMSLRLSESVSVRNEWGADERREAEMPVTRLYRSSSVRLLCHLTSSSLIPHSYCRYLLLTTSDERPKWTRREVARRRTVTTIWSRVPSSRIHSLTGKGWDVGRGVGGKGGWCEWCPPGLSSFPSSGGWDTTHYIRPGSSRVTPHLVPFRSASVGLGSLRVPHHSIRLRHGTERGTSGVEWREARWSGWKTGNEPRVRREKMKGTEPTSSVPLSLTSSVRTFPFSLHLSVRFLPFTFSFPSRYVQWTKRTGNVTRRRWKG